MDAVDLTQVGPAEWVLEKRGEMRVPGRIIASETTVAQLLADLEAKREWNALAQVRNVASLPGIVGASLALPDVHPGYGFPIGGVGAFDADEGVAVVGGVGFDINCGVRLLASPLSAQEIAPELPRLADALFADVPAGLGAEGSLRLSVGEIDRVLGDGAQEAVRRGYGTQADLRFTEEEGRYPGADPGAVSILAKQRQFKQIGTLGSGNHYLEVQAVEAIEDPVAASVYGLRVGQVVVSIHTGSRALGHQIGQDYLKEIGEASERYGIPIRERELVCAPIRSPEGKRYLAAVACGANCAFANRQVITHLVRGAFEGVLGVSPESLRTVYDIGHNNAKFERHRVDGEDRTLLVHRKGATRAFGPGRVESPERYRPVGHPPLVGGTMGTASYVLRGTLLGMEKAFGSGIHGAGRALSRKKAAKKYWGETVIAGLADRGIVVRAHSKRGIAEEAPGAYKDVDHVVQAAVDAGINAVVVRLRPLAVVKG
jgi:tRNA-splicing ligase RtcB (3'-phosphate/5'-hydroxy nucleic acid ligase)